MSALEKPDEKKLPSYLDRNGLLNYFPIMQQETTPLTSYFYGDSNEAGYEIPEYCSAYAQWFKLAYRRSLHPLFRCLRLT